MLLDVKRSAAWNLEYQSLASQVQPAQLVPSQPTFSARISLTTASAQRMGLIMAGTKATRTFRYKVITSV